MNAIELTPGGKLYQPSGAQATPNEIIMKASLSLTRRVSIDRHPDRPRVTDPIANALYRLGLRILGRRRPKQFSERCFERMKKMGRSINIQHGSTHRDSPRDGLTDRDRGHQFPTLEKRRALMNDVKTVGCE